MIIRGSGRFMRRAACSSLVARATSPWRVVLPRRAAMNGLPPTRPVDGLLEKSTAPAFIACTLVGTSP